MSSMERTQDSSQSTENGDFFVRTSIGRETIYYEGAIPEEDMLIEDITVRQNRPVTSYSSEPSDERIEGTKSNDSTSPTDVDQATISVPSTDGPMPDGTATGAPEEQDDATTSPSSSKDKPDDAPQVDTPPGKQPVRTSHVEDNLADSDDKGSKNLLRDVDDDVAKMLLYKPSGMWAAMANEPIKDAEILAVLNPGKTCRAYMKHGSLGGKPITYISKTWRLCDQWEGLFSELSLYSGDHLLRPLQGDVVPSIIGVYLGDDEISVTMALPSSFFWIEANPAMPVALKLRCIAAFDKIHKRGILHGDVNLRHILIGSDGSVTVTNFQSSRACTPNKEVQLKECTRKDIEIEARQLRYKLDYDGARRHEVEKRQRWFKCSEDNKRRERLIRLKSAGMWHGEVPDYVEAHPDDLENPVVSPEEWLRGWVDRGSKKGKVYVVSGQSPEEVKEKLIEFYEKAEDDWEDTEPPEDLGGKRKRGEGDEDGDEDFSIEIREPKKRKKVVLDGWQPSDQQPNSPHRPTNMLHIPTPQTDRPPSAFPVDPLYPVITIPYEGYTGPGMFTCQNRYTPEQVSEMRRKWIEEACMEQARIEGLPYPIGQRNSLTSSTDGAGEREQRKKWRKARGMLHDPLGDAIERRIKKKLAGGVSLGGLRRKREELDRGDETWARWERNMVLKKERYLRFRFFERTGKRIEGFKEEDYTEYADLDADTRIPKILRWDEFAVRVGKDNAKHVVPEIDAPMSDWDPELKPRKGILRVKSGEAERFANWAVKGAMELEGDVMGRRIPPLVDCSAAGNAASTRERVVAPIPTHRPSTSSSSRPHAPPSQYRGPPLTKDDVPINLLAAVGRIDCKSASRRAPEPHPFEDEKVRRMYSGERARSSASERRSVTPECPGAFPRPTPGSNAIAGPSSASVRPPKRRRTECLSESDDSDDETSDDSNSSPKAGPSSMPHQKSRRRTRKKSASPVFSSSDDELYEEMEVENLLFKRSY